MVTIAAAMERYMNCLSDFCFIGTKWGTRKLTTKIVNFFDPPLFVREKLHLPDDAYQKEAITYW
jgi:hypothetical protein